MVRSAALRNSAFSFGKGLLDRVEIGRVGRESAARAPAASMADAHRRSCGRERLSMTTMSPGVKVGTRQRSTYAPKILPRSWRSR